MPQAKHRPSSLTLAEYKQGHADRDQAIKTAYASGGYTMQEIGDYFGLHYSRISQIVRRATGRVGGADSQVKT